MSKTIPDPRRCNYLSLEEFVHLVERYGCEGTSMSFNEPTLLLEYSFDVFRIAKEKRNHNTFITNGYRSLGALKLLKEYGLNAANIDIKGDEEVVRNFCGADIGKVWRNSVEAKRLGDMGRDYDSGDT
ncbi:MAG: radical SAM protein [Candidatus Methanomethylicaceae archaeon]